MKASLRNLLLAGLFLTSVPAHAYLETVHYYVTYLLASDCGLNDDEALEIAWANNFTDLHPDSSAGAEAKQWLKPKYITIRRLFHFPVADNRDKVVHNSRYARRVSELAIEEAGQGRLDAILLGIGLHGLQDSFSHEGYGPITGHAPTTRPDFPINNVMLANEMAEATWEMLDLWSERAHGIRCRNIWPVVKSDLNQLFHVESKDKSDLAELYKGFVEKNLGRAAPEMTPDFKDSRVPSFLGNVNRIKKLPET